MLVVELVGCVCDDARADTLHRHHRRFEAHIQTMPAMYQLWLVCDATQRFTLEKGGYGNFWWRLYTEAAGQCSPSCESILFEAHRAAFSYTPAVPCDTARSRWVNDRFASFLVAVDGTDEARFYRLIYTALCLKQFRETEADILTLCEPFLPDLRLPKEDRLFAAGEWEQLNGQRSKRNQAQVGVNNAVNALVDSGNTAKARELYLNARQYGLSVNPYIEKCI